MQAVPLDSPQIPPGSKLAYSATEADSSFIRGGTKPREKSGLKIRPSSVSWGESRPVTCRGLTLTRGCGTHDTDD